MQSFELEQLDRQISGVFKSPAMHEKYLALLAEKDALLQKQSGGEHERLKRELEALKQAQAEVTERYIELSALAAEKAEIVRDIQSNLGIANGELNVTNFELATLANQISQSRAAMKSAERRLKEYEATNESIY